jgi:hypothetical protein
MRVFPRWTGYWLFCGALIFGPQTPLPPFVTEIGTTLLDLGFIEMVYFLLFKAGERE